MVLKTNLFLFSSSRKKARKENEDQVSESFKRQLGQSFFAFSVSDTKSI